MLRALRNEGTSPRNLPLPVSGVCLPLLGTGERTWRLPLEDSYWDIMKSNIADMKNAGNRYAGSITAGLFLKQYVDTEKVEWAHVDIAGCAVQDPL